MTEDLPCSVCGSLRVFLDSIQCPRCSRLTITDPRPILKALALRKDRQEEELRKTMKGVGANFVESLLATREKKALAVLSEPFICKEEDLVEWIATSHALASRSVLAEEEREIPDGLAGRVNALSRDVLGTTSTILSLNQKLKLAVVIDGTERIVSTEKHLLDYMPQKVSEELLHETKLEPASDILEFGEGKKGINSEMMMDRGLGMAPAATIIKSEVVSRLLKNILPMRLLPFIKDKSQCKTFLGVANALFEFASKQKAAVTAHKTDRLDEVLRRPENREMYWFFRNILSMSKDDHFPLSIIVRDTHRGMTFVPTVSLMCLSLSLYKRSGVSEIGTALNLVGRTVEELLYHFLGGYELQLRHPVSNARLINVKYPHRSDELADVMAFNKNYLFVFESKFWDCPLLPDLEFELDKFSKRYVFIKDHLKELGFVNSLKVEPIFYTPFPPYAKWTDIKLFPSFLFIGQHLANLVGLRIPRCLPEIPKLKQSMDKIPTSRSVLDGVDASEIDSSLQADMFNIHDASVVSFDEDEITVRIHNPLGGYPPYIILDIDARVFTELKAKGVQNGDAIRMAVVNLSGTWSSMQMMYFSLLGRTQVEDNLSNRLLGKTLRDIKASSMPGESGLKTTSRARHPETKHLREDADASKRTHEGI